MNELNHLFLEENIRTISEGLQGYFQKKLEKKQLTLGGADYVLTQFLSIIGERIDLHQGARTPNYLECNSLRSKIHNLMPATEELGALFEEFLLLYENSLSAAGQTEIAKILAYINENYQERITLTSLSNRFYISREYISRLFKKENGCSFIKYLTELRLDHSARMLRCTGLPLCEIVKKVGFTDSTYFIRVFKARYHMTPMEFRNQTKTEV